MNRIDDKIAIVTGGTQGLGAAIALTFAQAGARAVVIVGRDATKGQAKADEIAAATGADVRVVAADLANIDAVRGIVPQVDRDFGRVDILVNAAGYTGRGNILNTSHEVFDMMMAVNTRAPFFLIQDAAKVMTREGIEGRIVNIGSIAQRAGQPFLASYSTSKGGLASLTRNAGYALMRNRVHVNQLDIGWMASDGEKALQLDESGDPDWEAKARERLPFGRLLDPQEVARAVLWMASDDAGILTGAVIPFDQSVWGAYDGQAPGPEVALEA